MNGERFADGLSTLGLGKGDVIQIHSSLGSMGHVDGGAAAIVGALLDCVGPEGTIFSPAFLASTNECGHCKGQAFCPSERPSSGMGAIAEEFRKRNDVLRSGHRKEPFCGTGAHAREVIAAQKDVRSVCGPGSVFQEVYELDGYFLGIGVTTNRITAFHLPTEVLEVPNLGVYKRYDDNSGDIFYTSSGKLMCFTFPGLTEELLHAAGVLRRLRVELCTLRCLPAREFIDFLLAALRDDPTCLHLYPTEKTDDLFPDAARKAARMLDVSLSTSSGEEI